MNQREQDEERAAQDGRRAEWARVEAEPTRSVRDDLLARVGAGALQRRLARRAVERERGGHDGGGDGGLARAAALATSGAAGALPHGDAIQRSFGRHDVSRLRAYTDGAAQAGAEAMGAEAFAVGDQVGFAGAPSLHTAAHEAAHAVQQRAGVQLSGGVGHEGDAYERHADAVADLVVRGRSAEALLDEHAGGDIKYHGPAPHAPSIQRKAYRDLDEKSLENAGQGGAATLAPAKAQAAVAANNQRWQGRYRAQIIAFLRGGAQVDSGAPFTVDDVGHVARLQAGAGAGVDGIIGDATMSVLLAAGLEFTADVGKDAQHPTGKPRPGEVTIEFWPGELEDMGGWNQAIGAAEKASAAAGDNAPFRHLNAPEGVGRLYVKVNGHLIAKYDARGGPPRQIKDFGGHTADPTQGSFTVGAQQNGFTTQSWPNSRIPWGAKVRKAQAGYEVSPKGATQWQPAPPGVVDDYIFQSLPKSDGADASADVRWWNQNDFGAIAFRLQGSPGFYLHTTPETEEQAALGEEVQLRHSHGCVHLDPTQRDEMIARGYLQQGVKFVCKKYEAHLLPDKARAQAMGGGANA
jgi:hypothetical protein